MGSSCDSTHPRRDPFAGHTLFIFPPPCPSPSSGSGSRYSHTPPRLACSLTSTRPSPDAPPSGPSPMCSVRPSLSPLHALTALYLAFDDGRSQLLLCVHGLLPITYRAASYNIPMAFWITRDYPRHPPISYVVPTNNILVRAGKHIDVSGRCNSEYIRNWERKDEVGCIHVQSHSLHTSRLKGLQSLSTPRITPATFL